MIKRQRMSGVDTAWLRMDSPTNLMMITGVLILDQPMDADHLKATLARRFLSYRRFRQRVVERAGARFWEDDALFDMDAHVHCVGLPEPGGKAGLQQLTSDLMSSPLDSTKPLWQMHLIEHYHGGSALVVRIHHCYADGIALIRVMLDLTDDAHGSPLGGQVVQSSADGGGDALGRLFNPVNKLVNGAFKTGSGLVSQGLALARNPGKAMALAREGVGLAGEAARIALMSGDTPTRFKRTPGVRKQVAWCEPLPLAQIKDVGNALGCSVNDVLLSCVAGALRGYLADHGEPTDGVELRAAVPVNLRPMDAARNLGNCFGLVMLELPVGIEDPIARTRELRERMQALKGSYQAMLAYGLLGAVGMGPKRIQQLVLDAMSSKASAVMTNVPGPQEPLYLAGSRIGELMFWVPQSGSICLGVSVLSYDGCVQFGLVADRGAVPDPEAVISRFGAEFECLLLTLLMAPWPSDEAPADSAVPDTSMPAAPVRRRVRLKDRPR